LDVLLYGEVPKLGLNPVVFGLQMLDLGLLSSEVGFQSLDLFGLLVQNDEGVFELLTVKRLKLFWFVFRDRERE